MIRQLVLRRATERVETLSGFAALSRNVPQVRSA
jgi:hypothetical protein